MRCNAISGPHRRRSRSSTGTSVLLPVLVIVAAHSRFVTAMMIPIGKTDDQMLGPSELIQHLSRVPRRLICDDQPGTGQKGRLA